MRTVVVAHLVSLVACGGVDRVAPTLVSARVTPDTRVQPADPRSPLSGALVQTSSRPTIALLFSERLDGDAIEEVVFDHETGAVLELVGRDGVVRIAPVDGSVIGESIAYHPRERAIDVELGTHLPAETAVLVHVMAERVWDPDGNVMPTARYADGEPVRDVDGRAIAATVALVTEPVQLLGAELPTYGAAVPYDAPLTLEFNTAINPTTVVASIASTNGKTAAITVNAGADPTRVRLTPVAPLVPASAYELRIDAAADRYGIHWRGPPRLFRFSTQ